jgi:hypothetical protein
MGKKRRIPSGRGLPRDVRQDPLPLARIIADGLG